MITLIISILIGICVFNQQDNALVHQFYLLQLQLLLHSFQVLLLTLFNMHNPDGSIHITALLSFMLYPSYSESVDLQIML